MSRLQCSLFIRDYNKRSLRTSQFEEQLGLLKKMKNFQRIVTYIKLRTGRIPYLVRFHRKLCMIPVSFFILNCANISMVNYDVSSKSST